jgi:hypothetical protein
MPTEPIRRHFLLVHLRHRLLEVGDDVIDVFDADS